MPGQEPERKKYSKTKVGGLFKKPKEQPQPEESAVNAFVSEEMSIQETNALRLQLGLKPLKMEEKPQQKW